MENKRKTETAKFANKEGMVEEEKEFPDRLVLLHDHVIISIQEDGKYGVYKMDGDKKSTNRKVFETMADVDEGKFPMLKYLTLVIQNKEHPETVLRLDEKNSEEEENSDDEKLVHITWRTPATSS